MKSYFFCTLGSSIVAALFMVMLGTTVAQAQTSVSLNVAVKQSACATSVQEPRNNVVVGNRDAASNVRIFPNPASSQFVVERDNSAQGVPVVLSLVNTRGEIIWTTREQATSSGTWRKTVNTASMAAGAYIVTIETNGQRESLSVIIK